MSSSIYSLFCYKPQAEYDAQSVGLGGGYNYGSTGGKQVPGSFLLSVYGSLSYFFPGLPILESIMVLLR